MIKNRYHKKKVLTSFEKLNKVLPTATFVISTVGIIAIYFQLKKDDIAISTQVESTKAQVYISMAEWTYELDNLFIKHPDYRKYFYYGEDINIYDDTTYYNKVLAVAELILDQFDVMLENKNYFPGGLPHSGWKKWMEDCFIYSPILCKHIEKNRKWYPHLYNDIYVNIKDSTIYKKKLIIQQQSP